MYQSIPTVTISPPGNHGAFVQVLRPGGRAFMLLGGDLPANLIKTVKSPGCQDVCFIPLRCRLFWGKIIDFTSQKLVREGLDKLVEIFEVSFLILESFPVLYRSSYLSYIIYQKIKETYVANKKCISHSANRVDLIMLRLLNLNEQSLLNM